MCVYTHTHTHTHIYIERETVLVTEMIKNPPAMQRPGFDPWVGKFPGGGNGYPLQYSSL